MPELPQGGLLLRVLYLSLDPYMRGRMDDRKSYAKPVGLGEVMTAESVCEVIASDQAGYGVLGMPGFTAYAGLNLIGKPKPGETVVVAGAAGPGWSLGWQLPELAGAKAV